MSELGTTQSNLTEFRLENAYIVRAVAKKQIDREVIVRHYRHYRSNDSDFMRRLYKYLYNGEALDV